MPLELSRRSRKVARSHIRAMSRAMSIACARLSGINLAQGVCDRLRQLRLWPRRTSK